MGKKKRNSIHTSSHTQKLIQKKFNSTWIIALNINSKTIEILEEIIGQYLCSTGEGKDFLRGRESTNHKRKKTNIKLECIKVKHFQKTMLIE